MDTLKKLYTDHYSNNVLVVKPRLLDTILWFVNFRESHEPIIIEENGATEKRKCIVLQLSHQDTCIINSHTLGCKNIVVTSDRLK